jgi:hypothetical protein
MEDSKLPDDKLAFMETGRILREQPLYKRSLPYAVSVKNTTDSVMDVQLFGANKNVFELDKDKLRGLFIESNVPGVSYKEILFSSMSNPLRLGYIYVFVVSGDVSKCFKYAGAFQVKKMDPNGNSSTKIENIVIDTCQQRNNIWAKETDVVIDGNSEINFRLPPCSEIIIQLYPSEIVNIAEDMNKER